jgi:RNA polymerase sigma factor (sigma-70 family)
VGRLGKNTDAGRSAGHAATKGDGGNSVRLDDPAYSERLATKLAQLAWFRYRIRSERAEDIVQTAFATFLAVRHRYEKVADHPAILVGIFRKKCLEHIDRSVREQRKLDKYCRSADAARENPWIRPGGAGQARSVVDELIDREERGQITDAIEHLRPSSREMVSMIVEEDMGRSEMIEHLGLNKNTVDSRLHVTRRELRQALKSHDILA